MIRITDVYPIVIDPKAVSKDGTIDGVDDSKVNSIKIGTKITKSKSQDKSKGKYSAKALVHNFRSGFLIFRAR